MSTKHPSLWLTVLVEAAFFLFGPFILRCEHNSISNTNDAQNNKTSGKVTFRISVEEVQIDAVVLDKNGLQVPDLQKEDFEIYQDGERREILSSVYVAGPAQQMTKSPSTKKSIPVPISPDLARGQVRRTIAFIVDDLAMSFEDVHYARMAMRNFVEKQMEPGDLVTIILSSYGSSSTQMFTSDKKLLLARIENVRFCNDIARRYKKIADPRYYYFGGQLSAIQYCIRALKSMPGRKALMVLSGITTEMPKFSEEFLTKAYNILADDALRAGVVVNVLNVRGLEYKGAPEFFGVGSLALIVTRPINQPEKLNPLPQKTGGILVQNTNFFHDGIGDVNNAMKGYYLLSYTPPPSTFTSNEKSIYHRLRIKVNRRGTKVYTRDGFFGNIHKSNYISDASVSLHEAMFSPFRYNDLNINSTSGFMKDSTDGYLLLSWLNVDADNIQTIKKEGDGYFVNMEIACMISSIGDDAQETKLMKYEFRIKEENLAWVKKNGVRFALRYPVSKPGAYYFRIAVKDQISGKIGSVYQFVEIPDLKKGDFALSNIFPIRAEDDAAWISDAYKEPTKDRIYPLLNRNEKKTPELGNYQPGDSIEYMALIYNANHGGIIPELESQVNLYRDQIMVMKGELLRLNVNHQSNYSQIPMRKRLILGKEIPEGNYTLQLLVRVKQSRKDESMAIQTFNFEIKKRPL